jgi:GST-like protein
MVRNQASSHPQIDLKPRSRSLPTARQQPRERPHLVPPARKGSITVIDLYTWTTPNGRKISILLEELGMPYAAHPIDIGKGEQFKPDFLEISPNNRIPAIVDRDTGFHLMESGAIMLYLAEKTGKLMPKDLEPRYRVVEWLMWQMGGPGPMFGQVHHFVKYNPGKAPYAEARYLEEAHRLYGVLDRRLADHEFVADAYSIADIAIWPWVSRYEWQTVDLNQYAHVARWYRAIAARPAVQKGYHVPKKVQEIPIP